MPTKLIVSLIAVILFVIFVLPIAFQGSDTAGLIIGRVIDGEGRVVKDIDLRVFAYRKGQWIEGFFNKEKGSYLIQLAKGSWVIGAQTTPESGFTGAGINLPISVKSKRIGLKDIVLKRLAGVVSGKVTKPDGTKIPNAVVNIMSSDEIFSTRTDLNGLYEFLVPAGKYSVNAFSSPNKEIIKPKSEELVLETGQLANLSLVFEKPNRKISGKISIGNSPTGALVWAWSDNGGYSETMADSGGNYELRIKGGEDWHVKAIKEISSIPYESNEFLISVGDKDVEFDIDLFASNLRLPNPKVEKVSLNGRSVSVSLANGMRLSLPPGAVDTDTITVSIIPFIGPSQKSMNLAGLAYRINLFDAQGQPIRKLKKSGVLEIPYDGDFMKKTAAREGALKVFFRDEETSAWQSNGNSVIIKDEKIILGLVDHFTEFVVADPEGVEPFDVDAFFDQLLDTTDQFFNAVVAEGLADGTLAAVIEAGVLTTFLEDILRDFLYELLGQEFIEQVLGVTDTETYITDISAIYAAAILAPDTPPPPSDNPPPSRGSSGPPPPQVRFPTPPTIVNASIQDDSVRVTWVDLEITRDETYKIQRREADGNFADIVKGLTDSSYIDSSDLKAETVYFYRVIATNIRGDSNPSEEVSVETPEDNDLPVISNVDIVFSANDKEARLTFGTNEVARSSIEYGFDAVGELTLASNNLLNVHSYRIGNLDEGRRVVYQITVTDESNNEAKSEVLSFTMPIFSTSQPGGQPPPPPPVVGPPPPVVGPPPPPVIGPPPPSTIPPEFVNFVFTRSFNIGATGQDVLALQKILNALGFDVAGTGLGSTGQETNYYGNVTGGKVIEFQKRYMQDELDRIGIPNGTTFVGSLTRARLNALLSR